MSDLTYPDIIVADKKFTAIADVAGRLGIVDITQFLHQFIELVPDEHLHLLAEKWSVTGYDGWSLAKTAEQKRELIKSAYQLHASKGTPWAIRQVMRVLGFGEVDIIEGLSFYHNGEITRDGRFTRGSRDKWAYYIVTLKQAVTNEQAKEIKQMLDYFAPARCVLAELNYQAVTFLHNGKLTQRNGVYSRGAA